MTVIPVSPVPVSRHCQDFRQLAVVNLSGCHVPPRGISRHSFFRLDGQMDQRSTRKQVSPDDYTGVLIEIDLVSHYRAGRKLVVKASTAWRSSGRA